MWTIKYIKRQKLGKYTAMNNKNRFDSLNCCGCVYAM